MGNCIIANSSGSGFIHRQKIEGNKVGDSYTAWYKLGEIAKIYPKTLIAFELSTDSAGVDAFMINLNNTIWLTAPQPLSTSGSPHPNSIIYNWIIIPSLITYSDNISVYAWWQSSSHGGTTQWEINIYSF